MAYTDPITVSTNQVLGAGDWNTYIRDNLRAMNRVTSYTPVWTASTTNPSIGNGSLAGAYIKFEHICWVEIQLTWGSTTTNGSGLYTFTLPFAGVTSIIPNYRQLLPAVFLNDGVQWYVGQDGVMQSGATIVDFPTATNAAPFTWGVNDVFHAQGWYRTA